MKCPIYENDDNKINLKMFGLAILIVVIATIGLNVFFIPMTTYREYLPEFKRIINECPYSIEEYKKDVFDCSNMASMLDDWLELHGYESWIVIWNTIDGSSGHAMLLVNGHLVEPTTKTLRLGLMDMTFEGKYSNQPTIIDEPSQLGFTYSETEWNYPKRW